MSLGIRQIVHEHKHAKLDYPAVYNFPPSTPDRKYLFMESYVLYKCIRDGLHKQHDFFGIVAPKFKEKIKACKAWGPTLKNRSKGVFSPTQFEKFVQQRKGFDIISMTHHQKHSTFGFAERYHKGISTLAQNILDRIGFNHDVRKIDPHPMYFNYWVAKPEVCQAFHDEILEPLMNLADLPELWTDANYQEFPKHLQALYKISFWPYHPFIAERMITIFATKHNLKVVSF